MRKIFSFCIAITLCLSILSISATAITDVDITTDEVIATTFSQEEIEKNTEITLVGTQTLNFVVDEDGDLIEVIEGEISKPYSSSADWGGQYHSATVKLYKSGSKYYVSLSITAAKDWWVTKAELSNRAVGDSDWATIKKTYTNEPNSVTVTSDSVYFPDSPCDVQVKGYIEVQSTGILDKSYNWKGTITLDKP